MVGLKAFNDLMNSSHSSLLNTDYGRIESNELVEFVYVLIAVKHGLW